MVFLNKYSFINPVSCAALVCVISVFFNLYFLDGVVVDGMYLYVYGIFIFSIACAAFIFLLSRFSSLSKHEVRSLFVPSRYVICFYWVCSLFSFFLSVYKLYSVGVHGELGSFFLNLRYEASFGGGSSYGAQHFGLFSLALSLYYGYKGDLSKCSIAGIIYFVSALSLAERTSIFFVFVSVFYLLYYKGLVATKVVAIFFAVMIFVFIVIAVGAGKTGQGGNYDFIFRYVGYSITTLSDYVYGRDYDGCGALIFGTLYRVFTFGDSTSCNSTDDLFLIYDRHNVYTYVASPYLFAGWIGVTSLMALLGGWYAFLWHLAKTKKGYFVALLSIYMYALCMIFYAWQFSLTTYYYLALIMIPLFFKINFLEKNEYSFIK